MGILIRTGSHGLWKGVYAGNPEGALCHLARLRNKYPGFEVIAFEDPCDPEFINALIDQPGFVQE